MLPDTLKQLAWDEYCCISYSSMAFWLKIRMSVQVLLAWMELLVWMMSTSTHVHVNLDMREHIVRLVSIRHNMIQNLNDGLPKAPATISSSPIWWNYINLMFHPFQKKPFPSYWIISFAFILLQPNQSHYLAMHKGVSIYACEGVPNMPCYLKK